MGEGPSREEIERLYTTIDDGFRGVHTRLDGMDGRITRNEVVSAEVRTRITSVEKEVFRNPRRRIGELVTPPVRRSWLSVNKRESALLGLGLGILATVMKLCLLLGDVAVEAIKAALKVK
jgi:hypothetical protein